MSFFETNRGSNLVESMARSLERIASALEEQNRLIDAALKNGDKQVAKTAAKSSQDVFQELCDLIV